MKRQLVYVLCGLLALLIISGNGVLTSPQMAAASSVSPLAPEVESALAVAQAGQMIPVIVRLRDQADLRAVGGRTRAQRLRAVVTALKARSVLSQRVLRPLVQTRLAQGRVSRFEFLWILNGFAITASPDFIQELSTRPEVASITPDLSVQAPAPLASSGIVEPNLSVINAPALWSLGYQGQGVVVASMDTGVDYNHPDLQAQWRGGSNSWFDPSGQHPTVPTDVSGHGTWTMGVMVGRDLGGSAIGVAPAAQWIAVKIFNDQGSATATGIHQGYQWLLDPDGNTATADAPDVVNNSWAYGGPGCNLEFQPDLQALVAAGIVPVFAAGNYGPGTSTSVSPANYPEAFSVGATNNADTIYAYSSRGPTTCGQPSAVFPRVVAPGVNVLTTDLFGFYYATSGTSLSAPHASGALALLLSAYPDTSVDQQEAALTNSAVDLGTAGADDNYGAGRIDALAAYNWLQASLSTPTPTSEVTPTSTSVPPTATPDAPTATAIPPTSTPVPPTDTPLPPTATAVPPTDTPIPPTATPVPPTATPIPPTATTVPPTATPTRTSTPRPTATSTPASLVKVHVGDLDGIATLGTSSWTASVTVTIHDASHQAVSGAKVTGNWSNGYSGSGLCVTAATGLCTIVSGPIPTSARSVRFTVGNVTGTSLQYASGKNHDPDGDSSGKVITVRRP